MEQTPVSISSSPAPRPPMPSGVGFLIVLSLVFGGVSGATVSYFLFGTSAGKNLTETVASGVKTVKIEESSATIDVVKKASPAVVSIVASKDYSQIYGNQPISPFDQFFGIQRQIPQGRTDVSSGSGFIVQADGLIITNKHVVSDTEASYTVVMNDGKKYDAKLLASDPSNDIAFIKIDAKDLPTLTLGDSDSVQIGQSVVAIGNALGQYRNTVTQGVISGKARTITAGDNGGSSETLSDVFQTDASINPGNSGGPLLDLDGSVIAMNTAIDQQGTLIGFAIPINVVKKDLESVTQNGKVVQPYLGVRYILITKELAEKNKLPSEHGALIQRGSTADELAVIAGSPADKAGLVENDIILSLNGQDVTSEVPLTTLLAKFKPGDVVTLSIYHKGDKKDVKVTLEERK